MEVSKAIKRVGLGVQARVSLGEPLDGVVRELGMQMVTAAKTKGYDKPAYLAIPTVGYRWLMCGFPTIEPSHKLAASLMCTALQREHLDDVAPPWNTFSVRIPKGLVRDEEGEIVVIVDPKGVRTFRYFDSFDDQVTIIMQSFKDLLETTMEFRQIGGQAPLDQSTLERENSVISRLVAGVCIEMDSPERRKQIAAGPLHSSGIGFRGEPVSWTFKLTRPVKLDVREAVRDFVSGKVGGKLSLQHMVRGHHKRQPCGVGLTERKWIHVEPYWRGPEDAPIALRSHELESTVRLSS